MDKQKRKPEAGKKSYSRPEFQIYGNLAQITTAVGNKGNPDAAKASPNMTQV